MASHNGPIVMRKCRVNIAKCTTDSNSEGEPDFPAVEVRDLSMNIGKHNRKCTTVCGEKHAQEEQSTVSVEEHSEEMSIAQSIMESVNLILPAPLNCPLPPVAGGCVRDSGSDRGLLLDVSGTEVVPDLEGFGKLNLKDFVPETESDEDVSDNNYQSGTRPTDMAATIDESVPGSPDFFYSDSDG